MVLCAARTFLYCGDTKLILPFPHIVTNRPTIIYPFTLSGPPTQTKPVAVCGGESGGTSCVYDLAERYRLCNLVAERDRAAYGSRTRLLSLGS